VRSLRPRVLVCRKPVLFQQLSPFHSPNPIPPCLLGFPALSAVDAAIRDGIKARLTASTSSGHNLTTSVVPNHAEVPLGVTPCGIPGWTFRLQPDRCCHLWRLVQWWVSIFPRLSNRPTPNAFPATIPSTATGGTAWPTYLAGYANLTLYSFAISGAACNDTLTPRTLPDVTHDELSAYFNLTANTSSSLDPGSTLYTLWIGELS
jgi:hypothetical protein